METLCFLAQNGGAGKSTLSVHFAAWLAERGYNVAVFDSDPQACTSTWLSRAAPGLKVFTPIEAAEIQRIHAEVSPHLDVLVADTKPGLDSAARAIAKLSDRVLMPIIPSGINLTGTEQAIATLDRMGLFAEKGDDFCVALLNMVNERSAQTDKARRRMKMLGVKLAEKHLGYRLIYREAYNVGAVVWKMRDVNPTHTQPARLASEELHELFQEIVPNELRSPKQCGEASGDRGTDPAPGECETAERAA